MEMDTPELLRRQIWAPPSRTSGQLPHTCTPFRLPSGGEINIGHSTIITLTQDGAFQPACSGTSVPPPIDPLQPGVDLSVLDARRDPFYSSTNPQIYAIAAVTTVSYMLLIILYITPRTFFVGGAGGGSGVLGQRGIISGAYGSNSVIGIGSRPWLQKLAALTVAISLTIVTADTFRWAHRQYDAGYQDATELNVKVINGLEIRVVRTISETCLWLAQAQTLIRLFPRHKEKLAIKWTAFAMIILELVFSSVNHFASEGPVRHSKGFLNAIPALNYLFALALNLCYGAFVIYYALCKRRFAFYHPQMRNMPLVALLSFTAVFIPVVFFILDLSQPNVSDWGSYVRWVGAAAASVVVWEWVERIEALERNEKKDGILGREIFDGDEMLEATPSSNVSWPSSHRKDDRRGKPSSSFGSGMSASWSGVTTQVRRLGRSRQVKVQGFNSQRNIENDQDQDRGASLLSGEGNATRTQNFQPMPPPPVASPVSRTDTTSAASTVYVVRYHPGSEPTPPIQEETEPSSGNNHYQQQLSEQQRKSSEHEEENTEGGSRSKALMRGLQRFPNPFSRQHASPPPEVALALARQNPRFDPSRDDILHPSSLLQRLHLQKSPRATEAPRPVIVIPAPRCRRGSFNNSEDSLEDEDDTGMSTERSHSTSTGMSTARDADRPPDAVLNAINHPQSTSPLSDHGGASVSTNDGCISPFSRTARSLMPEIHRRHDESPASISSPKSSREQNSRSPETISPDQLNTLRTDHDR
ncbi:pH-response regulator protein palH/rim21 [Mycoblastus sanguinarius]|nr:pH-response regulator protein palH/rim21 [Mycoblastus sanguinarius]